MTASHPQYSIVTDSISPHSNSQQLTVIHCDEPNTGFEPRLISAYFFARWSGWRLPCYALHVILKTNQDRRRTEMKILITTDCYTPMINGVVTSIRNLETQLRSRGHEVKILAPRSICTEKAGTILCESVPSAPENSAMVPEPPYVFGKAACKS